MLDDIERMEELDPEGMIRTVRDYPEQLRDATTLALPSLDKIDKGRIQNVLFVGMGGSGAGGSYAQQYLDQQGGAISRVVHDYEIPRWVDERTLVVATSYSGGTEETLASVQQAMERGAQCVTISSGGALKKVAEAHQLPHLAVPADFPPRGAFGYLMVPVLRILAALDIVDRAGLESSLKQAEKRCRALSDECDLPVAHERNRAKRLAEALHTRITLLVADTPFEPVAERIRCQLNENSKVLAFSRALPESNHNDTVAWTADATVQYWTGLFVGPFARNPALAERARFVREILEERGLPVLDLDVPDDDLLVHMMATTYLGDWVSLYLAFLNGEDPSNVASIPRLKERAARTGYLAGVMKSLGV